MCGLCGILLPDRSQINRNILSVMNDTLAHRGPDASGLHEEAGLGLGHRRLSIIDISGGHQPLYNEDQSVVVAFNGEIYNFQELASSLQEAGHQFNTRSDTEVIVHAWEEWGVESVKKFRGMFAFALWDRKKRLLFLARDRLGIKPLFYAGLPDAGLIFASELKALLAHPDFQKNIDPRAVEDFFSLGYIPEPRTVYRNTWKLEPGHYLLVKQGRPLPHPVAYWDVTFTDHCQAGLQELQAELTERIREAVKIRLISEVPLGAFLSGGVDSSCVVAMMAGLMDDQVNTCSISFPDPAFNEAEYARLVADQWNTRHREKEVNQDDFNLIDKLATLYDEPYADSSAMPTYRVCQLAREQVTVALSGDGGDENMAGYRRYQWHMREEKVRSAIPLPLRRTLFGVLGRLYPKLDWMPRIFRAKTTFQSLARDSVAAYFHSVSTLDDDLRRSIFSPSLQRELQGYNALEIFRAHAARAGTDHPLSLIQYIDLKTYLPGDILTKVDRASMAHSLEVRVPLLDHELVEWMASLPPSMKLHGNEGKFLFKKSLEPYLPHTVLYRRKMGFAVPLASWFRGSLRDKIKTDILGERMLDSGYFNRSTLRKLIDQHQSGMKDFSVALWSLLMFDRFLRH